LLRDEFDFAQIAQRMALSVDTVRIYEALYWNVRGRDKIYVASLVYPQTRRALELANELYTKGLGDFLRVLDAERSLYQVEDELVDSQRGVTQNLVALYKALGGGWEAETRSTELKPTTP